MSDIATNSNPLAPEISPLTEADPNSVNEFIKERVDRIFNSVPKELTDEEIRIACAWYRKERERFVIESANKPIRNTTRKRTNIGSVKDALAVVAADQVPL